MTLNCPIIHHSGAITKTVSVRELIVDDQELYRVVKRHVLDCPECNPVEAIKYYLDRRKNIAKFEGFTSVGLIKLVHQYDRGMNARKRGRVPEEIIREFIWRCGEIGTLIIYQANLSNLDIWNALYLIRFSRRYHRTDRLTNPRLMAINSILVNSSKKPSEEELDKLMLISEISNS